MVLPNLSKLISSFLKKTSSTENVFAWNLFNKTNTKKAPWMIHYGDTKPIEGSDVLLACLSFCNPFSGRLVRIPYSRKFCFVLTERAEILFHILEKKARIDKVLGLKLLPSLASQVMVTESVAKKILDAMSEGLMLDKGYKINGEMNETCFKIKEDMKQSRLIWKPETKHLNGREWEIEVAEELRQLGICHHSGRIIISGTLLPDHVLAQTKEAMVATILAHELGHAVAKHGSRKVWNFRFVIALPLWCRLSLDVVDFIDLLPVISLLVVLWLRFSSRRHEAEADYSGLMLMASAGYLPRVAPIFYQHMQKAKCGLFSAYYSGDKRAELLNRNKVMKEALKIYDDAIAGNRVKSFV